MRVLLIILCLTLLACQPTENTQQAQTQTSSNAETAQEFVERYQKLVKELSKELYAAAWVRSTYITEDTAILAAKANERWLEFESEMVNQAKRFKDSDMDAQTARAIELILRGSAAPAPANPEERAELARILTEMEGAYGAGKYCDENGNNCRELQELEHVLATSQDYDELLDVWQGWRQVSPAYRKQYQRFVELANSGAKTFGYNDLSEQWRSGYDMPADEFSEVSKDLWLQVKPFYEQLQCYVRAELSNQYGADKVPLDKPIPAHLLGNMWSQTWDNIYKVVEPYQADTPSASITESLQKQNYDELKMVKTAENFFTSIGLPALPDSFYKNSMIKKPADRAVVCHASAWDMNNGEDPRIKQCVEITEEQLTTLHHELGHIYYYLLYKDQPPLFKGGAHDGFHEAIGDTIELSMTPEYLKKIGLVDKVTSDEQALINQQMKLALKKIAFLPFGKLIDEWRWKVFSGEIKPEDYNKAWWELREKYQGIRAPIARTESDFDPGAKYHIPGNTPYTRYFLSYIMQFQFHKALCDAAGFEGPLHECSIYQNTEAGKKLAQVLAMGQSQPWPVAMKALTGQEKMDASAIIDYFAPLNAWLKEQNKNRQCGW